MSEDYEEDEWFDWDEDYEEDLDPVTAALESGDLPCEYGYCGPECPHWLGDHLCELVIERQTEQFLDYRKRHVRKAKCPVCGAELTMYDVQADELWIWNPAWYDPMIALEVYGPYGIPKGVIHSKGDVYHIWVGEEKNQKLIKLIKKGEEGLE